MSQVFFQSFWTIHLSNSSLHQHSQFLLPLSLALSQSHTGSWPGSDPGCRGSWKQQPSAWSLCELRYSIYALCPFANRPQAMPPGKLNHYSHQKNKNLRELISDLRNFSFSSSGAKQVASGSYPRFLEPKVLAHQRLPVKDYQ